MLYTVVITKVGEIDVVANHSHEALQIAEQLDQQGLVGFHVELITKLTDLIETA